MDREHLSGAQRSAGEVRAARGWQEVDTCRRPAETRVRKPCRPPVCLKPSGWRLRSRAGDVRRGRPRLGLGRTGEQNEQRNRQNRSEKEPCFHKPSTPLSDLWSPALSPRPDLCGSTNSSSAPPCRRFRVASQVPTTTVAMQGEGDVVRPAALATLGRRAGCLPGPPWLLLLPDFGVYGSLKIQSPVSRSLAKMMVSPLMIRVSTPQKSLPVGER